MVTLRKDEKEIVKYNLSQNCTKCMGMGGGEPEENIFPYKRLSSRGTSLQLFPMQLMWRKCAVAVRRVFYLERVTISDYLHTCDVPA